ncbi:MAG: flagellar protein FlaG [Gemmatimonadota bacterium]|nr:flagellar protein FlaG [Gemmatimonadota bacterium]
MPPSEIGNVKGGIAPSELARKYRSSSGRPQQDKPVKSTEEGAFQASANKETEEGKPAWEQSQAGKTEERLEKTERLLKNINTILDVFDVRADQLVDPETHLKVIQLKEQTTGTIIRQVPSEEFLQRVLENRKDIGRMIDKKA